MTDPQVEPGIEFSGIIMKNRKKMTYLKGKEAIILLKFWKKN